MKTATRVMEMGRIAGRLLGQASHIPAEREWGVDLELQRACVGAGVGDREHLHHKGCGSLKQCREAAVCGGDDLSGWVLWVSGGVGVPLACGSSPPRQP
jgi:hypothetical protein